MKSWLSVVFYRFLFFRSLPNSIESRESSPFSPMADLQEFSVCRPHIVWHFLTDPPAQKLHAGFVSIRTNLCLVQVHPIGHKKLLGCRSGFATSSLALVHHPRWKSKGGGGEGREHRDIRWRVKKAQGPYKKNKRCFKYRVEYFDDLMGQIIMWDFVFNFFLAMLSFFLLPFERHEITKLLIVNRMFFFYPGLNSIGFRRLEKQGATFTQTHQLLGRFQLVEFFRGLCWPLPRQAAIYWSSLDTLTEARKVCHRDQLLLGLMVWCNLWVPGKFRCWTPPTKKNGGGWLEDDFPNFNLFGDF